MRVLVEVFCGTTIKRNDILEPHQARMVEVCPATHHAAKAPFGPNQAGMQRP